MKQLTKLNIKKKQKQKNGNHCLHLHVVILETCTLVHG